MRPVRLEMEGFASFRAPTTVDFVGADYFSLVGPTGSGKSSVIDAMVFALYGSAPRWGHVGAVKYALAPSAARCVVRLVFDVGPDRYQVAREVRRSAAGVQQRSAALERFNDPSRLSAATNEVTVLASEVREVTPAVEELLRLSFEDFTKAVVLPQGQFAQFLNAKPGERQEILLKLLGAHRYDLMMKAANARQQAAAVELAGVQGKMDDLAYATPESEAEAVARLDELAALQAEVTDIAGSLEQARTGLAGAAESVRRAAAEADLVASVSAPKGLDQLQRRASAVRDDLVAAKAGEAAALEAHGRARAALDEAGDRTELVLWQRAWAEENRLADAEPALVDAAGLAEEALREATARAGEAEGAWSEAVRVQAAAQRASAEAAQRLADLEARWEAVAAAGGAGSGGDPGERARAANVRVVTASLREHLAVGDSCPVCAQVVDVLPEPIDAVQAAQAAVDALALSLGVGLPDLRAGADLAEKDLRAANEELKACGNRHKEASRVLKEATARAAAAGAALAQCRDKLAELAQGLNGAPDADEVAARLVVLDERAAAESAALKAGQLATTRRLAAETAERRLADEQQVMTEDLRTTRDRLVPLGAPGLDGLGLADGWARLAEWAAEAKAGAKTRLASARSAQAGAEGVVRSWEEALVAAAAGRGVRVSKASAVEPEVRTAIVRAADRVEAVRAARERLAELELKRAEVAERGQVASLLADTLKANRFQRWLATAALDVLVDSASGSLYELSGEQFGLTHDNGEFFVIDHGDADAKRSVRTLSGGETFQASLALALALSAELSALTTSASLESLFLDEGFGSLDPDSLELVALTLERLAQGERMVGIVTHVTSLAERVPTRFRVTRNSRTSVIEREG